MPDPIPPSSFLATDERVLFFLFGGIACIQLISAQLCQEVFLLLLIEWPLLASHCFAPLLALCSLANKDKISCTLDTFQNMDRLINILVPCRLSACIYYLSPGCQISVSSSRTRLFEDCASWRELFSLPSVSDTALYGGYSLLTHRYGLCVTTAGVRASAFTGGNGRIRIDSRFHRRGVISQNRCPGALCR